MKLIQSKRKGKRFAAVIDTPQGQKTYHFGSDGSAYIDHGDERKKAAYIARHAAREDWTKVNPGSLSRFLLWETPDLYKNMRAYRKRFGLVSA